MDKGAWHSCSPYDRKESDNWEHMPPQSKPQKEEQETPEYAAGPAAEGTAPQGALLPGLPRVPLGVQPGCGFLSGLLGSEEEAAPSPIVP